ncbi:GTPase IMAP family member 7-like [Pimephales promelas]|nr:GTPase IMAP family member 7-like [Pimephales promelas]
MRGDSRFSAADILSGRKAGGQEDREIVKTPVMTDEGRRMMLVTGPNLCEDDTATQSFTTALFLSSPGPHAVLILLEDQESEECDVVKRVQERLGADVLQYCIVLLHQNHQERLTGASREMINACGGRFHMIRDSDPKPAQTAALVAEIHKLVWLNAHRADDEFSQISNDDADVRILIVGMRGDSRFSAADILSGWKAGGQEDREIVKTPVMTDEGRRMMQVTGPNLCEDDTATQSFTTALFLSSPGPHAVLILLEDQESEECDVVKRVQERLGADVLQYCIVLLHQNHQERLTGASREMINACGGRFHMIRDSDPKPAQTAALVAEIHKLVWLNAGSFFSALNETQQSITVGYFDDDGTSFSSDKVVDSDELHCCSYSVVSHMAFTAQVIGSIWLQNSCAKMADFKPCPSNWSCAR